MYAPASRLQYSGYKFFMMTTKILTTTEIFSHVTPPSHRKHFYLVSSN